jgi:hypothetical protein
MGVADENHSAMAVRDGGQWQEGFLQLQRLDKAQRDPRLLKGSKPG